MKTQFTNDGRAIKWSYKFVICLIFLFISCISHAAIIPIAKTTGAQIFIPSYNAGDTLRLTGDTLQTTPVNDWNKLKALTVNYHLDIAVENKVIPSTAFYGCTTLLSFSAPNVMILEFFSFNMCSGLTELSLNSLPKAIKIGSSAFASCVNLKSIYLPEVTTIESSAFENCKALEELSYISLPKLETVAGTIFKNCQNLRSVYLPNLKTMNDDATFSGCVSLTEIFLPQVTRFYSSTFENCTHLEDVFAPNVESIGGGSAGGDVFKGCDAITTLFFPKLKIVASHGFQYTPNLTTLFLPSCTEIGTSAFSYCNKLELLYVPQVTKVGYNSFNTCPALKYLYLPEVTTLDVEACFAASSLVAISLPKITNVPYTAFGSCPDLVSVSLSSVTSINYAAFEGSPALKFLELGTNVPTMVGGPMRFSSVSNLLLAVNSPNPSNYLNRDSPLVKFPAGTQAATISTNANDKHLLASGATLTLTTNITGASNLQWKKDGVAISGANSSTYTKTNVQPDQSGLYSLSFTYNTRTYEIVPAMVMVGTDPTITGSTSRNISYNTPLSEQFTVTGSDPGRKIWVLGTLPKGVTMNQSTYKLEGTPIETGIFPLKIYVLNDYSMFTGNIDMIDYTLTVEQVGKVIRTNGTPIAGGQILVYPAEQNKFNGKQVIGNLRDIYDIAGDGTFKHTLGEGQYIFQAMIDGYQLGYYADTRSPEDNASPHTWLDATIVDIPSDTYVEIALVPIDGKPETGLIGISGDIIDPKSDGTIKATMARPVAYATVILYGKSKSKSASGEKSALSDREGYTIYAQTHTDEAGNFSFADMPQDHLYYLMVEFPGYWMVIDDFVFDGTGKSSLNVNYLADKDDRTITLSNTDETNVNPSSAKPSEAGLSMVIYPNPAKDLVRISPTLTLPQGEGTYTLRVFNSSGQQLVVTNSSESEFIIDVSGFKPGIYFIRIEAGGKIGTVKLVKNR